MPVYPAVPNGDPAKVGGCVATNDADCPDIYEFVISNVTVEPSNKVAVTPGIV